MGYLTATIAELGDRGTGPSLPRLQTAWQEATATDWLLHAPRSQAARRALMIAALRQRMRALADRLDPKAIDRALDAMAKVPRDGFVCPLIDDLAYLPMPLNIGLDQVISHPELVAVLAAAADPRGGRVLDVGTGSGYQAAVLAQMSAHVTSVEILGPHARLARARLVRLGYANVTVVKGDAADPAVCQPDAYDAIVVAAGSNAVPPDFLAALKVGGRLVMPVGPSLDDEHLVLVERIARDQWRNTVLRPSRFVPLTGRNRRQSAV